MTTNRQEISDGDQVVAAIALMGCLVTLSTFIALTIAICVAIFKMIAS